MSVKNWEELISMRNELIGRDVEINEMGGSWRGPLKDIVFEGKDGIRLLLAWSAELNNDDTWTMITDGPFGINRFGGALDWASWHQIGDIIEMVVPMTGTARILPESAGHLGVVVIKAFESVTH